MDICNQIAPMENIDFKKQFDLYNNEIAVKKHAKRKNKKRLCIIFWLILLVFGILCIGLGILINFLVISNQSSTKSITFTNTKLTITTTYFTSLQY